METVSGTKTNFRLCVMLSKQACNVTLGNLILAIKATES